MPLLPFLKNKKRQDASVIIQEREPDQAELESEDTGLKAAAQDILSAIKADDADALAGAIQSAFQIIDSQPHEEGPHTEQEETE